MDRLFKMVALAASVMLGGQVLAQDGTNMTKKINKQYKVAADVTVDISNKYGRVAVKSWEKDSVMINIEITAYSKDTRTAQRLMERVEIDLNNMGSFVTAETVLDRGSSSFKELMNTVGDYSKTVLSANKVTVDYEVTLPVAASLYLDNKFGDVFIADHNGPVRLTLAHGDFKANELKGKSTLDLSFGKSNVKRVADVELTLKAAQVDIQQARNVQLTSMTSELRVESVLTARVDSRNDKLNFGKIGWVSGKGMFTDWVLGEVQETLDLQLNYGQVIVQSLHKDFGNVRVSSKFTDLDLTLDSGSWVNLDIQAEKDKIYIPGNWFSLLTNMPIEGKEDYVQLKGMVGKTNSRQGNMGLDVQGGTVTLRYFEALPFTKN